MNRLLALSLLFFLSWGVASAAPEISVEIEGASRVQGASVRLVSEAVFGVSDPIEFNFSNPSGPIAVSFPGVLAGDYHGEVSFSGEFWFPVTPLIVHPAAGTLTFNHDPGASAHVFYRLTRFLDSCVQVTIRNTGDAPLTGIAASLTGVSGGDFTLDDSSLSATLAAGDTTTVTVCFSTADANVHNATLHIASNDADENPFDLALIGANDHGPMLMAPPVISVFTDRTNFETVLGPAKFIDTFSNATPLLPVTSARGAVVGGKWSDIARDPEPSTVWAIPGGALAWGGTWDLSVAGTGGGIAFELDFGGGNILTVPGQLAPGSPAGLFFGFTADQPFYKVRVRQIDSQGNTIQETHTFDDMCVQLVAGGEIAVHDGATTGAPQLTDGQSAPVDLGTVARSVPTTRSFTIVNTDAEPLQILDIRAGGAFQIANAPALPVTLATGQTLNFDAVFSSAAGGTFSRLIRILSSDGDEAQFDFTIQASVTVEVELQVTNTQNNADVVNGQATVIDIQPNPFGGGSSVSLNVANTGPDPLHVSAVSLPAGFFYSFGGGVAQFTPVTINPGTSVPFNLTSTGPTQGVYEGTVTLTSDDADEGTFTFPVRALFNMPEITVGSGFSGSIPLTNGGALDAGSVLLGGTRSFQLRVANIHAGPLIVSGVNLPAGILLAAPAPAFPFSLAKDQVRDIGFTIDSSAAGSIAGTLAILNNDFDEGPFNIQLSATVQPESIRFFGFSTAINEGGQIGAFGAGTGPVSYAWDLDNDGQFDDATGDTVSLPDTDGPDTFLASVRMTDSLTSMVQTQSIPVNNVAPSISELIQASVLAGTPLVIDLTANDAIADKAAGMAWRIDWGDGNVETTPAGHASVTTFSHTFTVTGQTFITIEATDKDGATGSTFRGLWVHSAVIGVFDGPDTGGEELQDGQSTLSFRTLAGGTQDRTVTVLNRSASPASIGPVTLPAGYQLVAPPAFPATLAPGGTLPLTVRFAPPAGGSFTGNLMLGTSDPLLPVFDIALSGFADAPDIRVSEFNSERFDFASGEASFSFSPGIENFNGVSVHVESDNSDAPLIIQSIDVPAGFRLVVLQNGVAAAPVFPLDLDAVGSKDFRVQCSAVASGFYEGWVSIVSNDPDESPFRYFVTSRVGSVADLRVSSATTDTSSAVGLIVNGQSDAQTFPLQLRLRNQGDLSLTVNAVTLPAGFAFASPPALPVTLSASGSTTLPEIRFTATDPGTYSGEVVITSTDPDENPFQFTVSATVPGDAPAPAFAVYTLTQSTPATGVIFGGAFTGPAHAMVIVEGSADLGRADDWSEIGRLTLGESGTGSLPATSIPGTTGIGRYFIRIQTAP